MHFIKCKYEGCEKLIETIFRARKWCSEHRMVVIKESVKRKKLANLCPTCGQPKPLVKEICDNPSIKKVSLISKRNVPPILENQELREKIEKLRRDNPKLTSLQVSDLLNLSLKEVNDCW